ncbi:hypothetical protein TSAR_012872 [Trichomalopsis sarcophagae]|uniref:Uncharacterized protein n=1 Tax=Trichomalopsis sarcophagae TaxID=543379 RepID=A0A232EPQ8_9HYME|nr:hypothetical protein TSAR_012872 [Trichomalopsis sarcophagae]
MHIKLVVLTTTGCTHASGRLGFLAVKLIVLDTIRCNRTIALVILVARVSCVSVSLLDFEYLIINSRNNSFQREEREPVQHDTDEEDEEYYFSTTDECDESESSDNNLSDTDADDDDDEYEDDDLCIKNARKPLYPGATINVAEHVLSVLSLMLRLKMTGVLIAQIFSLIRLHCIQPNYCIKSIPLCDDISIAKSAIQNEKMAKKLNAMSVEK